MNALATTRAAEGFDRVSWTVADVRRMINNGVLDEDGAFELWEGEFVPRSPKYNRHEIWKRELCEMLINALPRELVASVEPSVFFGEGIFPKPDIIVAQRRILPEDVRGPDLLLVVEIASISLARDLKRKAQLYAQFGVRHYWVLDAERRRAFVHRLGEDGSYGAPEEHGPEAVLETPLEPVVQVPLARLG